MKKATTLHFGISFNGKTIEDKSVQSLGELFEYILSHAKGRAEIIKDSFTEFDLLNGTTKQLIIRSKKQSFHVYAGQKITTKDLTAQYDSFGTLIPVKPVKNYSSNKSINAWLNL